MVYLNEHLKKYPLMQIEDILKLYLQGIMGPAHIVSDYESCLRRTQKEYESITNNQYLNIEELISDKYVRIYLYPYYEQEESFDLLVKYFVLSSKDENDINEFINEVKKLINDENEEYINDYLSNDNNISII